MGAKDLGYSEDFTPEEIEAGADEAEKVGDTSTAKSMKDDAKKLRG